MSLALTMEIARDEEAPSSPPGEIDPETIEGCRRGERRALRRFVLHYQDALFAFLSRMTGAGPHVEDMAQEVFIRAYRALPRFELREGVRVSTWLLKIAVRLVQDSRKRRRPALVPLKDHHEPIHRITPESERRQREIVEAFERAAAQIPEDQLVVFVLAHFHGLSMTQIAGAVGATENTVKTRLYRAREKLRQLLSEEQEP